MSTRCCGIRWSRILLLRAICVNISFVALMLILVLVSRNQNLGDWLSIHDTRVLTYHGGCNSTETGGKECSLQSAVDTYVDSITKSVTCTAGTEYYADPRSTKGIVWRDTEPLFRYVFVNRPFFQFRFWGYIFSNFNLSVALIYVYVLSLGFQLYTFYFEYLRTTPYRRSASMYEGQLVGMNIGRLNGNSSDNMPHFGANVFDDASSMRSKRSSDKLSVDVFDAKAPLLDHTAEVSTVCAMSPWDPGFADGASFLRWAEYGLTSGVQLVVFSLMMQNTSINQAALMLLLQLVLCLLGYIVEYEIDGIYGTCASDRRFSSETRLEKKIRGYRVLFVHVCAWLVHVTLWTIIFEDFRRYDRDAVNCIHEAPGAPAFVHALIYSQGAFFTSFGLVQLMQVCTLVVYRQCIVSAPEIVVYSPSTERWQRITAYGYAILNVVSKFFIAIILLGGLT